MHEKLQRICVRVAAECDGAVEVVEERLGGPEDLHEGELALETWKDSTITAEVNATELLGADMHLYINIDDVDLIAIVGARMQVKNGDVIKMALDNSRIHVFDKETELVITN